MTATRSRGLLWLFAGAIAWRLAIAGAAWTDPGRLSAEEDSAEYVQIAHNLSAGHGFSQSVQPPYTPDVRRTPVYPALLAALFSVPGTGARCAAVAGVMISAVTVLATFRFAAALVGPRAAWWAAFFLATDLTSAAYATQLLTEPLFTLLLVLSFLPLLESPTLSPRDGTVAGALSGMAALCRPIAVAAFAALLPACAMRAPARKAWAAFAAASILAIALIGAWTWRNYRQAGTATVSSVGATNMYFHRAAYVQAWLDHRRVEDQRDEWTREFAAKSAAWSEQERVGWMNEHGRDLVLRHPLVYAIVALRGAARMSTPDRIILGSLAGGEDTVAFRVLHAAGWVQLACIYGLAAMAMIRLAAPALRLAVPLAPIVYFLLIGGPEMYPRFRVPIMPFVCVIAAAGIALDERR